MEVIPFKKMKSDAGSEDVPPEDIEADDLVFGEKPTDYSICCHCIQIGSYNILPLNNLPYLFVNLSVEVISFFVPWLNDSNKYININLRGQDITKVLGYFGRCQPLMFIFTTREFGEAVRSALGMTSIDDCYFDPTSQDEKIQKITFFIERMSDGHRNFIRHCFPGEKKVKDIEKKEANEILMKSTPSQNVSTLAELQTAPEQPPVQKMPSPPVAGTAVSTVDSCPTCQQILANLTFIDHCHNKIPPSAQQITINKRADAASAFDVTKNMTPSIQKQIAFQFQDQTCLQFQQNVQGKVTVETNQSVLPKKKGRRRAKGKYVEPVVYNLDSDEEEQSEVSFNPVLVETQPHFYIGDSDGIKSEHSNTSEVLQYIYPQKVIPLQSPQPVNKLLIYPPLPITRDIAITSEDLQCLNEGEFLNDAIIDFYLKYIFNEKITPNQRETTHIFSSSFYPRLTSIPEQHRPDGGNSKNIQGRRHNQVKTWTRHVDIFSKDFIIIPVKKNARWFLIIICYPGKVPEVIESPQKSNLENNKSSDKVSSTVKQENNGLIEVTTRQLSSDEKAKELPDSDKPPEAPDSTTATHLKGKQRKEMPCMCIFDSLSRPNRWRISKTLRNYLEIEWKMKKRTRKTFDRNTMPAFVIKCPQQAKFSDSGTYLLQFVECFFENPITYFGNPMPDLRNWFPESKILQKRHQLKELIFDIHRKQVEMTNVRQVKNTQ